MMIRQIAYGTNASLPFPACGDVWAAPLRMLALTAALLSSMAAPAAAQSADDTLRAPVLRANVNVTGELVRVGDLIENAGTAARIALYRAPDLGTTGTLATAQVLSALRAHDVIGVNAGDIKEIAVTRLARTISAKDIEVAVAHVLEHRGGLGDAESLSLTFDRELQDFRLDAANSGAMQTAATRFDPHTGRFDVTFEIPNDTLSTPTMLRFTGSAIETVETAVLTRNVERTEMLKASDLAVERRPRAQVGNDAAGRDQALGMQMRRPMRAGQSLHVSDLTKPDLVQRDQSVTIIYQTAGIYLTSRGKALDNGAEGDVVNVLNPQSKRTVTGVVSGRGQVTIQVATPTPVYVSDTAAIPSNEAPASVAVASGNNASPITPKPE